MREISLRSSGLVLFRTANYMSFAPQAMQHNCGCSATFSSGRGRTFSGVSCTKLVERTSLMQSGSKSATSSRLLAYVRCTAVNAGSLAAICEEQA